MHCLWADSKVEWAQVKEALDPKHLEACDLGVLGTSCGSRICRFLHLQFSFRADFPILVTTTVNHMAYGWFSKIGSLWGSFFIRVPYYIGDPKGDPHLENYPYD